MVLHPSSDFFSAIQCCQWRKAKCFQSLVLACQSFLSCVQQTNENVFCAKSTNAFALQHLTSKTEREVGTTKRRRLLLYALYLAQPNKKLCFFLDCIPPSRIWPLPKPTTQNLDFTYLDWKVCRLHGRKYLYIWCFFKTRTDFSIIWWKWKISRISFWKFWNV